MQFQYNCFKVPPHLWDGSKSTHILICQGSSSVLMKLRVKQHWLEPLRVQGASALQAAIMQLYQWSSVLICSNTSIQILSFSLTILSTSKIHDFKEKHVWVRSSGFGCRYMENNEKPSKSLLSTYIKILLYFHLVCGKKNNSILQVKEREKRT